MILSYSSRFLPSCVSCLLKINSMWVKCLYTSLSSCRDLSLVTWLRTLGLFLQPTQACGGQSRKTCSTSLHKFDHWHLFLFSFCSFFLCSDAYDWRRGKRCRFCILIQCFLTGVAGDPPVTNITSRNSSVINLDIILKVYCKIVW